MYVMFISGLQIQFYKQNMKQKISNCPSIQEIKLLPDKSQPISEEEVNRLFITTKLPRFELRELKAHPQFNKSKIYQFFVEYLQSWNKKTQDSQKHVNIRTQLFCSEFIYSSLKRIIILNTKNVDEALCNLYKWFQINSKSDKLRNFAMPQSKKSHEDQWEIRKTFKYNTALQINSYKRKFLIPTPQFQNSFGGDNFITCPKIPQKMKLQDKIERTISYKLQQEELRKIRQMKEIQAKQAEWKNKRMRFEEESMKDYYKGRFNTTIRYCQRTSNLQDFSKSQKKEITEMKHLRVQSSLKMKRPQYRRQPFKQQAIIPENISALNLMKNPTETKQKLKSKKKKN